MRFYSDELKQLFNSEKELVEAEKAHADAEKAKKLKEAQATAERKADAAKVEKAFENLGKATEAYKAELNRFVEKWGQYHYSTADPNFKYFLNLWDLF